MLPERHLQLLTAYVDGELSSRQRRAVARLLRSSEEARELLAQLRADAAQLRRLPRVAAPIDFSGPVLAAIGPGKRRLLVRRPNLTARRGLPVWPVYAAAAAVLLLIGVGSIVYFSPQPGETAGVVKRNRPDERQPGPRDEVVKNTPTPRNDQRDETPPPPRDEVTPRKDREPERTPEKPLPIDRPLPEQPDGPIFATGGKEPFSKFERIELSLPVVFKLHELDQPHQALKLREQVGGAAASRVELLARNATRAFDRVRAVLEARRVGLVIDPIAQAKLKAPQFRHDYALFIENITPADLAEILAALGAADRAGDRKYPEKLLDSSLVVKDLSRGDQKELAELLGVDPIAKRPAATSNAIDPRKPISDSTISQVADVLNGKRAPRPGTTQPDLSALVVPLGGRSRSAELKRFLDVRKPARPETIQVFVVLRTLP